MMRSVTKETYMPSLWKHAHDHLLKSIKDFSRITKSKQISINKVKINKRSKIA